MEPAFSPDRSKIVLQLVTSQTNTVTLFEPATGQSRRLFAASTNRFRRYEGLSVNDHGTAAFLARWGDDTNRNADVFVVSAQQDPPTATVVSSSIDVPPDTLATAGRPVISPDGKRVYFKMSILNRTNLTRRADIYVKELTAPAADLIATGSYFSTLIETPAGPIVLGGAGDFGFATPSEVTDLALLPYPAEIALKIAKAGDAWKISFPKIPDQTAQLQYRFDLGIGDWNNLVSPPQDEGSEWSVTDPALDAHRFYRLQITP